MVRVAWKASATITALSLLIGTGTLSAGVWDFWKSGDRSARKDFVARAQEPIPAPPALPGGISDPAYSPAAPLAPTPTMLPMSPMPWETLTPTPDGAPMLSGFSSSDGYDMVPAPGCRVPATFCGKVREHNQQTHNFMTGKSYYCDCPPLFGPRYGYYTTCWRRLPEDCRCPIPLPPKKTQKSEEQADPAEPQDETVPSPPQVLNFR